MQREGMLSRGTAPVLPLRNKVSRRRSAQGDGAIVGRRQYERAGSREAGEITGRNQILSQNSEEQRERCGQTHPLEMLTFSSTVIWPTMADAFAKASFQPTPPSAKGEVKLRGTEGAA
jgi:hypothetical protein